MTSLIHNVFFLAMCGRLLPSTRNREIQSIVQKQADICLVAWLVWDAEKQQLESSERTEELLGCDLRAHLELGIRDTVDWFNKDLGTIRRPAEFPAGTFSAARGVIAK